MRRSSFFLLFLSLCLVVIAGLWMKSVRELKRFGSTGALMGEITFVLSLTDLSFSNDARYTRHASQADLFSAFQDYPGSIEHFPSGSVGAPPDFGGLGTTITVIRR